MNQMTKYQVKTKLIIIICSHELLQQVAYLELLT